METKNFIIRIWNCNNLNPEGTLNWENKRLKFLCHNSGDESQKVTVVEAGDSSDNINGILRCSHRCRFTARDEHAYAVIPVTPDDSQDLIIK